MESSHYSDTEVGSPVTETGIRGFIRTRGSGNNQTIRRVVIMSIRTEETWGSLFRFFSNERNGNSLSNNVHLESHWAVCVVDGDVNDIGTLLRGKYFDFPRSPFIPDHPSLSWPEEIIRSYETKQDIGLTNLSDIEIENRMNKLNDIWGTSYPFLWNCQYFAVFLAQVILRQESWGRAVPQLKALLRELEEARWGFRVVRHIACMAGMVVLGATTGGIGAFISWAVAGGSMASDAMAESDTSDKFRTLLQEFQALRLLFR